MWSLTLSSTRNKYAPQFSDRWCEEAREWKLSRDNGFYKQASIPAVGLSLQGLFRKLSLPPERTTARGGGSKHKLLHPYVFVHRNFFLYARQLCQLVGQVTDSVRLSPVATGRGASEQQLQC